MVMNIIDSIFRDRARAATVLVVLNTLIGIFGIAGGAMYGATFSSGNVGLAFVAMFVPITFFWVLSCYGAHRGLKSDNVFLRMLFWIHVLNNFFIFPVGTATSCLLIWLRRDMRRKGTEGP